MDKVIWFGVGLIIISVVMIVGIYVDDTIRRYYK